MKVMRRILLSLMVAVALHGQRLDPVQWTLTSDTAKAIARSSLNSMAAAVAPGTEDDGSGISTVPRPGLEERVQRALAALRKQAGADQSGQSTGALPDVDLSTVASEPRGDRMASFYNKLIGHASQAAQETGIPAEDIVKLAREYATTPPAVVRIGVAVERHAGGGQTVRAIACLPGLIGAWKHVGGGLLQRRGERGIELGRQRIAHGRVVVGQHQHRPVGGFHRLPLLLVQARQIGRVARNGRGRRLFKGRIQRVGIAVAIAAHTGNQESGGMRTILERRG